jgi:predicted DNA-binding transcriptional regulator AlpA
MAKGKRMNDTQQLAEAVGKAVVAELAATVREPLLTDRLWTAQNCADYLCVSRSDFYRIAANPTFPEAAVNLNRGGKLAVRRWKPKDVMRWRGC